MNKRRYSRGWDFGFSKEYVTIDSRKKSKPISQQDTIQDLTNQDYKVYSFENEQFMDSVINQDSSSQRIQPNDSSDIIIQTDSSEIIVVQPDETGEEPSKNNEEEALEKDRIWYTISIVFLCIFGVLLIVYMPYWLLFMAFGGNFQTFLIVSIIMFVGLLINIFTLIKAGLVLMKETDYLTYESNYKALSLLSILFLGFVIGILFAGLFKRNRSKFKNYDAEKSESSLSKVLRTLLWTFVVFLFLVLLTGC